MVYAILTLSVVVLTGWAGQVSLGQVAFFAIGAAVGGKMTIEWHADLLLVVPAAGAVGAVAAVAVGLPALRARGIYLAVSTFAFALAVTSYLLDRSYFSWVPNERIERLPLLGVIDVSSPTAIYHVMLGALVLTLIALRGIRHSRTGRVLLAQRDNERAAEAFSIDVIRAKLVAFALSGFLAAGAGALFVHHQQALGSNPYAPGQNLGVFTMAVVGGITSLPGALLGSFYLQGVRWFLPLQWQFLASGVGVLAVLMLLPNGLGGLLFQLRDAALRRIAERRNILVPSLVADRRIDDEIVLEPPPVPARPTVESSVEASAEPGEAELTAGERA
jgi:branched-chain amino acid transport system permease protein